MSAPARFVPADPPQVDRALAAEISELIDQYGDVCATRGAAERVAARARLVRPIAVLAEREAKAREVLEFVAENLKPILDANSASPPEQDEEAWEAPKWIPPNRWRRFKNWLWYRRRDLARRWRRHV